MAAPKFAVRWSFTARDDLSAVLDYLSARTVHYAAEALDRIKLSTARLNKFPQRGRIVAELKEHGILAYHEIICPPWRIIYRIEGRAVWVLSLVDARRNVEDLLLERFLRH